MGGAYLTNSAWESLTWRACGWAFLCIGLVSLVQLLRNVAGWKRAGAKQRAGGFRRRSNRRSVEERYDRFIKENDKFVQPLPIDRSDGGSQVVDTKVVTPENQT